MYSKKYILNKLEQFNDPNPVYDDMEVGCVCYPAYFNVGERGWLLYETGYFFDYPHRIHTSIIQSVEYFEDQIVVTTQNTRFTFKLME